MASVIKALSLEANVTTANTVSNARLVRVHAFSNTLITVANSTANMASLSVFGGTDVFIEKQTTDTITANVAAAMTSVAFRN